MRSTIVTVSLIISLLSPAVDVHNSEVPDNVKIEAIKAYDKRMRDIEIARERAEIELNRRLEAKRIAEELERKRIEEEKKWFNIVASHYSDGEEHNGPGNYNTNAVGDKLVAGTIAVPFQNGKCVIPMYSVLVLEDSNGNREAVMALDTGNSDYIRVLTDNDKRNKKFFQREIFQDKVMMIDYYMPNTSMKDIYSIGHREFKAKVVRWGKSEILDNDLYIWAVNNMPYGLHKYLN